MYDEVVIEEMSEPAAPGVYVLEFSNGTVKVGHSGNLKIRVANHEVEAARWNSSISRKFVKVTPDTSSARSLERSLIKWCSSRGTVVGGSEYFRGLDFAQVLEFLVNLPAPDPIKNNKSRQRVRRSPDSPGMQVSVAEAARRLDVSPSRVRAMISDGALQAESIAGRWVIEVAHLQAARSRPRVRPLNERMAHLLVLSLSSETGQMSPLEKHRLAKYQAKLLEDEDPAELLSSWLRHWHPERMFFQVSQRDLRSLVNDDRLLPSGFSDERSRMAPAGEFQGWVYDADLGQLIQDHLLIEGRRGNLMLWVSTDPLPEQAPLGWVIADLVKDRSVREMEQARRMIRKALA